MPEFVTKAQLAEFLQVQPRTVQNMVSRGQLPQPVRIGAKFCRWSIQQVREDLFAKATELEKMPTTHLTPGNSVV